MKITAKLSITFALLSILSIAIIGFALYRSGRQAILEDKFGDLVAANDYTQAAIERWMHTNQQAIETIAGQPFFRNEFAGMMAAHDINDPRHMQDHQTLVADRLAPYVAAERFLELFILQPKDGVVTFSTDKTQEEKRLAKQPFFRQGKNGSYIQNVYFSMSLQRAAMTVSTPIWDGSGRLIGVLAGHLNLKELSDIMTRGRRHRQTLDTYLVNQFNFFVTEPRFGENVALKKAVHTTGVNAALSGETGIDLYRDYRNEPVIGAFRWMPEHQLALVSEIDQAEALGPIRQLQKRALSLSGAVGAVAAFAGWIMALTITGPLKRLMATTQTIGTGDLNVSIDIRGKDEISALSRAFQRMVADLSTTLISRDALASEIAERKRAEYELRESEVKFRTLSDASPVGIFIVRQTDLKLVYANPAIAKIFGYSQADLIEKRGPMDLTHPDDHAATRQYLQRVLEGHNPGLFSFRGLPRDGSDLVCEAMVHTIELEGIQMFMGTLVDVTERIRATEKANREHDFSDMVINSLPGVFYLFEEQTLRFQRWNRNFEQVTGYASSELTHMSPLDLFDPQEGLRVAERIGAAFQKGHATVEADLLTKNGERIPYFFTGHTLQIDDVSYLIGMGIDVSERRKAEQALQESEDRFRRLAENAKDMIYRMSLPDGRYEYVSPASSDIFGYAPEVFYTRAQLIRGAIHRDWRGYFAEQWQNLLAGNMPDTYEYQIVDAAGQTKWLNQRNVLIRDAADRPVAIEGIVTDVTDIKQAFQEQIRLEKFAALGQLVAGVAHELNNPLMGVLNYAQYCLGELPADDEKHLILQDIEHETKRCIGIVQNLLGASRVEDPDSGKVETFSPGAVLERVVRLMDYRTSKENVQVTVNLEDHVPDITMNSEAFQQLCLNLFTNAVDAVETTGTKKIRLHLSSTNGVMVLSVSDSGIGIPETIKGKIFDPFFTTKGPGKGTGLGLATCWKIAHQHGGSIQCSSANDAGTTMVLMLPIQPGDEG